MASRICWHCEKDAHQTLHGHPFREHAPLGEENVWFAFFRCDACGYGSVGKMLIMREEVAPSRSYSLTTLLNPSQQPNVLANLNAVFNKADAPIEWLPQHVIGRRFDDVPEYIADAASEAYSCFSIRAYRAAILMARSVVEAVAKDKGITKGLLANKIDALAEANHIRPLIQQSAHEIRHLGNDMAHGDFVEPTAAEDAEDMLDFMSVVLAEVYQLPAQVNARQATRAARAAQAAARKADTSEQ